MQFKLNKGRQEPNAGNYWNKNVCFRLEVKKTGQRVPFAVGKCSFVDVFVCVSCTRVT